MDQGELITVYNVSGGKSSSYKAFHYPSDYYLFACVLPLDSATRIQDSSLRSYCAEKLPFHDWDYSGSRELDLTLQALRDLEQLLGREITWVASDKTYDDIIANHNTTPSRKVRFCTVELKIEPLTQWLYMNLYRGLPILEQIGFRADEKRDTPCSLVDIPVSCNLYGKKRQKWRRRIDLREILTPMVFDGITIREVTDWVATTGMLFPETSNCDFCFFKSKHILLRQASRYPDRLSWWLRNEELTNHSFYGRMNEEIGSCFCGD